jgi:hypothetical protein
VMPPGIGSSVEVFTWLSPASTLPTPTFGINRIAGIRRRPRQAIRLLDRVWLPIRLRVYRPRHDRNGTGEIHTALGAEGGANV